MTSLSLLLTELLNVADAGSSRVLLATLIRCRQWSDVTFVAVTTAIGAAGATGRGRDAMLLFALFGGPIGRVAEADVSSTRIATVTTLAVSRTARG